MPCNRTPKRRIARARALIGVPFRLHGREPASGVDCVGFTGIVLERMAFAPRGYALRGGTAAGWAALMDAVAMRRRGAMRAGDLLLMRAGPAQFHLGLWTGTSLIHADAGLRRTVETPGDVRWDVVGVWGRVR